MALVSCAGYVPGRQAYWDAQVKEMCEKDGGVSVYERIEISETEYIELGGIRGIIPVPDEQSSNKEAAYFSRTNIREINTSNPRVTRRETEIVRRADNKKLGKVVTYSRVGGDLVTGIRHDTYFSCQDVLGVRLDVENQIFIVRGKAK